MLNTALSYLYSSGQITGTCRTGGQTDGRTTLSTIKRELLSLTKQWSNF